MKLSLRGVAPLTRLVKTPLAFGRGREHDDPWNGFFLCPGPLLSTKAAALRQVSPVPDTTSTLTGALEGALGKRR